MIPDVEKIVAQDMRNRNAFSIPQVIPPKGINDFHKIFNINTWHPHWTQELGSLGTYLIPQAEENFLWEVASEKEQKEGVFYRKRQIKAGETPYSRPCLVAKVIKEGYPIDVKKLAFQDWDGQRVAWDVLGVGPHKNPTQDLTAWGCFLAEGDVPTKEELEAAEEKMLEKCEFLWCQAETYFLEGSHRMIDITAVHRQADRILGRRAQWNPQSRKMISCPCCSEPVSATAAVHLACGAVIDAEKAKTFEKFQRKGA
jgi:hypothetical protein